LKHYAKTVCVHTALFSLCLASVSAMADDTLKGEPTPASAAHAQTSTQASAEAHKSVRGRSDIYIGPEAGAYFPVSAKTRNRFGTGWVDYGPSLGSIYTARDGGAVLPDIHILNRSAGTDRVLFVLVGAEYRKALIPLPNPKKSDTGKPAMLAMPAWIPYAGAGLDLLIGDALSYEDNVHSGIRQGFGGSVFSGVTYRNRAYIEARFIGTSTVKSFDLSGFSINVGLRFRL
jgi:hypothetical protein